MSIKLLPVEVLSEVFRIVRDDAFSLNENDMSWITLAGVCKRWCVILHGCPLLWTKLVFQSWTPPSSIEAALSRAGRIQGLDVTFDAGSWANEDCWLADFGNRSSYTLQKSVSLLTIRWHERVRDEAFTFVEALQASGVVSLTLFQYDKFEPWCASDPRIAEVGHTEDDWSDSDSDSENSNSDDWCRVLGPVVTWEHGTPRAVVDDSEETDSEVGSAGGSDEGDDEDDEGDNSGYILDPVQRRVARPPRILLLPDFPSLVDLTVSGFLVSLPASIKAHLQDMSLLETEPHTDSDRSAILPVGSETWLLDVLEDCTALERLRLSYTLRMDGDERPLRFPRLEFLSVEDHLDYMDTFNFFNPLPETVSCLDRGSLFPAFKDWDAVDDGVFRNVAAGDHGLDFISTVHLELRVDDEFRLRGWTDVPVDRPGVRIWRLGAICPSEEWTVEARDKLLPVAVNELSLLVDAARVEKITMHLAPSIARWSPSTSIAWERDLFLPFSNLRSFLLGGSGAVEAFLWFEYMAQPLRRNWPDLKELHFCVEGLSQFAAYLFRMIWPDVQAKRPDLKAFFWLPHTFSRISRERGLLSEAYMRAMLLTRDYKQVNYYVYPCKLCHKAE